MFLVVQGDPERMMSLAAVIGFLSLVLLLGFVSYLLYQLGAVEIVRLLIGVFMVSLAAVLIGALL